MHATNLSAISSEGPERCLHSLSRTSCQSPSATNLLTFSIIALSVSSMSLKEKNLAISSDYNSLVEYRSPRMRDIPRINDFLSLISPPSIHGYRQDHLM